MAIRKKEVALGVRVVLNDKWETKCLGDEFLQDEKVLYISDGHVYNDQRGEYVRIGGGSHTNGGYAYLDQLDLEFDYNQPIPLVEAFKEGSPMAKAQEDQ
jgi:hypothetical protein